MDKIAQKANQAKASNGSKFEAKVGELLEVMKDNKKIKDFRKKPSFFNKQFNPDFMVEKNNGELLSVDSTTTMRTDRLKAKQWDAYGAKKYFLETKHIKIKSFVVVQDTDGSQKEKDNFRRGVSKARGAHSSVDDVISIDGLVSLLETN